MNDTNTDREKRIMETPDNLLNSPGAKRLIKKDKGTKGEELKAHSERMGNFMKACKKNRGFAKEVFSGTEQLVAEIDQYIDTIIAIGLFPTWTGLALFCDVSPETLYAVERLGDERSDILQKYKVYISEFFNQSGLASSTNPIFSIYYGKSVLGQSDQAPVDINVNISQGRTTFEPDQVEKLIELTPKDYKALE